jgi:DNA-binding NarL/FixJ family response regulator
MRLRQLRGLEPLEGWLVPVRVVIADDDSTFLESLRGLVDAQPELEVVGVAGDGLEAIELTEALEPDAVVLDLHMPRLDGVTAIARLRADHPNICLIALTGDPAVKLRDAVLEAGADAVFLKGQLVETLFARLNAARVQRETTASRTG